MKKTKMISMFMSLIAACSSFAGFFTGESRQEYDHRLAKNDATLTQPLTLLGKRIITRSGNYGFIYERAKFYFDADGNTNTTEVVATKIMECPTAEARVFDAKIGETKTIAEWRKSLLHKDEDHCTSKNPYDNRINHDFNWVRVKE